jgi:hypothetical protein
MLSIEKCKELLEKEGNKYKNEEVKVIMEFLLELIQIQGLSKFINEDEKSSFNGKGFE